MYQFIQLSFTLLFFFFFFEAGTYVALVGPKLIF